MITYPLIIPGALGESFANLKAADAIGESISPFSGSAQQQQWQDQHWELDLEFPEMQWAQAAAFQAFLGALHGKLGSFLWGPPLATAPRGSAKGMPTVGETNASPGPSGCGIVANGGSGGLIIPWTNPGNVELGGSNFATVHLNPSQQSAELLLSGFGFYIPPALQVLGIVLTGMGFATGAGVQLLAQLQNSSRGSLSRQLTLGTVVAPFALGVSTDQWGPLPWQPGDVSQTSFGCFLKAFGAPSGGATISLQGVQLQIFVSAVNGSGTGAIYTVGWMPNQTGALLPGDFFELNVTTPRLYQYVAQTPLITDGGGNALIDCFPSIREAPPAGTTLTLLNPQGTFRLAENVREAPARKNNTIAFKMKCREAI